jgi:surfeit locus 1 family protein
VRLPTPLLLGLLALALVVLVGLGVWQLQRNEWKQDLLAESYARTDAPPLVVEDSTGHDPGVIEYRRVELLGEWAWDDTMFLANRARNAVRGEEIVVPFAPHAGPPVLVNLGWIPDGTREEVMRDLRAQADGTVHGLAVDASRRDGRRAPSGSWTALSPRAMGSELGYELTAWFVIAGDERDRPAGIGEPIPVQGWQRLQDTTPHMEYALTWFGIAVVLVVVAVVRLVVAPRRASQATGPETPASGLPGAP